MYSTIVVFHEGRDAAGLKVLSDAGFGPFLPSEVYASTDLPPVKGVYFATLGFVVVDHLQPPSVLEALASEENSPLYLVSADYQVSRLQDGPLPLSTSVRKELTEIRDRLNLLLEEAPADDAGTGWNLNVMNIPQTYTGQGIRVAVLDTGFGPHSDFAGRAVLGASFVPGEPDYRDNHGHGTHCAGLIAGPAVPPSGVPRYGVAPEVTLLVAKVLTAQGGSITSLVAGLDWALANRADIISLSLGQPVDIGQNYNMCIEVLARRARRRNVLILAAAGNDSQRPSRVAPVAAPADTPTIRAVGAVDRNLRVADFSNGGLHADGGAIDVVAPGVDIHSTWLDNGYQRRQGTSVAAPQVAGLAALYAQKTGARGDKLWQIILDNAQILAESSQGVGAGLARWRDAA